MISPRSLKPVTRHRLALHGTRLLTIRATLARRSGTRASIRLIHSVSNDPDPEKRPPYINAYEYYHYHIPPEIYNRTVAVVNAPRFAIGDDYRDLFEESDIAVDRVVMIYDPLNCLSSPSVNVILESPSQLSAALELDGEALFHRRVQVVPYGFKRFRPNKNSNEPSLSWGWFANESSSRKHIKVRHPRSSPVPGIFEPFRQGRVVAFQGFPRIDNYSEYYRELYAMLHRFNVLNWTRMVKDPTASRFAPFMSVEFSTREEADTACRLYNNTSIHGHKLHVAVKRPPMKFLGVSWDPGHNRAHFQPRDFGSAKGTNFEAIQDEVYRKWLLKDRDRGLWVPDHKY